MEDLLRTLGPRLATRGFDLLSACSVSLYNARAPARFALDDLGEPSNAVVLIGNSRALWSPFIAALRADPSLVEHEHPLDDYTRASVLECLPSTPSHRVYLSSDAVLLQELASVSGLCHFSRSTHLCVHPVLGAAVVFSARFEGTPPSELPCPCEGLQAERMEGLMARLRDPEYSIQRDPQPWIDLRALCPHVGLGHAYSEPQVLYHYTKNKDILRSEVRAV